MKIKRILHKWFASVVLILLSVTFLTADESLIEIGSFSKADTSGWNEKVLKGKTSYTLVSEGSKKVQKAESNGTASAFLKEVRIDLDKTPYLNWQWKIKNTLNVKNEKSKSDDDYPARIYVILKTGNWPWSINAVNYVWSSVNATGSNWPNAYTSKAWMIAVASGNQKAGAWKVEKRNVQEDFKQYFNKNIRFIDAVAIMTDTDDSKSQAVAYYGDIYFSAQ